MLISKTTNKRGDISIVILVFLVVFVVSASLFVFVTSSLKENVKISGAAIVDKVKLQENSVKFHIKQVGEKSVIKTYKEIINNKEYIGDTVILVNNIEPEFKLLNENLNENFKTKFINNFKSEFESYNFEGDYLKNIQSIIYNNLFDIGFNGEILVFSENKQEFYEHSDEIQVTYQPIIKLEFNFTKIGIESFEKIYSVKEQCKNEQNAELIKQCFDNNLINFNTSVIEKEKPNKEKYFLITLTSKKEFLINDKFEKIEFSFTPK